MPTLSISKTPYKKRTRSISHVLIAIGMLTSSFASATFAKPPQQKPPQQKPPSKTRTKESSLTFFDQPAIQKPTQKQIIAQARKAEIPARFLPRNGLKPLDFSSLIPENRWQAAPSPKTMAMPKTAAEHAILLRTDSTYQTHFWLESMTGDSENPHVVFVIPQFHRSTTQPLDWSSLGEEIRTVQNNIDLILTQLAKAHGLRCVGTEGSPLDDIQTPNELKQIARWRFQLQIAEQEALEALGEDGKEAQKAMHYLRKMLDEAMKKRLQILDGTGLALLRLRKENLAIQRFGVEDFSLNSKGVSLLKKISVIDEKLALFEPESQSTSAGVIGQMWLEEYPLFSKEFILPFQEKMNKINAERKILLAYGDEPSARILARFSSIARHILRGTFDVENVTSYYSYYQEVESRAAQLRAPSSLLRVTNKKNAPKTQIKRLTHTQKRQKKRLLKRRAKLEQKYEQMTYALREKFAVKRVLAHMTTKKKHSKTKSYDSCALIFGAHHTDALVEAFAKKGVTVLVVAPFHFES